MNKSLTPTVEGYVKHTIELDKLESELMQIERQLLEAKKSRIFAYNKGESTKLRNLDEVIKELTLRKKDTTELFEETCKNQFYMYSTYTNASSTLSISELEELIETIKSKIVSINLESNRLEERKMQLFGLANTAIDIETAKKCRELSSKCHSKIVDLAMKTTVYSKVKEDITEILKKKQEESTPQMR